MPPGGAAREPSSYGPSGAFGAVQDGAAEGVAAGGLYQRPAGLAVPRRTAPTRNAGMSSLLLFTVTP
ncbi:hypothetical protein BIV25_10025 [Streptomyces sp. MUSC 14]|uniref:hypothetical protein n=1 Tax=Streptomyces sp. MUSC 14 TaxID=1354889 RepID=UPI0008F56A0F|nr:hypothetical protein [Streptomyces sp. MUSC 14]OIJ99348.1 hypothetical protein BIV25_10025 [Streptomyces sp. MUSC 14]